MPVNLKRKAGKPDKLPFRWRRLVLSIHTRILAWYILLMTASALVTVLVIRQVFLTRMQERVERSLVQEVQEFRQLVDGRDPATGEPFGDNITAIFKVFLRRNIPEHDEFLLALLNGKFYLSNPRTLPQVLAPDGELIKSLAQLTKAQHRWVTMPTGETILYRAESIVLG